jgi:MFS family permease
MADLFDLQQRSKFITVIGLTWTIGTITGPVVGGGFTQSVSWVSRLCNCPSGLADTLSDGSSG